nr:unnamed protein product [Spirometra erinaceieuropaei]
MRPSAGRLKGRRNARSISATRHLTPSRVAYLTDLATVPDVQWTRARLPEAYMTYPMDLDLKKVVMAYSYGLALNVHPINNPSLSVVRSSKSVCQAGSTDSYFTMIIVKSALTNYAHRLRLREVIRRQTAHLNATVGILFSLGLPANGQVPSDLLKEIAQFDDILLANYTDTYLNLTIKTIVNLRFVHRFCLHASPSFVFLDDDHAINLTQLHTYFSNFSSSEVRGGIFGFINSNTPVLRAPGRHLRINCATRIATAIARPSNCRSSLSSTLPTNADRSLYPLLTFSSSSSPSSSSSSSSSSTAPTSAVVAPDMHINTTRNLHTTADTNTTAGTRGEDQDYTPSHCDIGPVGHLRIHRTVTGKPVPGAPTPTRCTALAHSHIAWAYSVTRVSMRE